MASSTSADRYSTMDEYNFQHQYRGTAVIINNINFDKRTMQKNRQGALHDSDNLKATFDLLGFTVDLHENLTTTEMLLALRKVAKQDHSRCDCVVCVISSHGDQDVLHRGGHSETTDVVYGTDGILHLKTILDVFRPRVCPTLAGKPKLFFIQACRGPSLSGTARVVADSGEEDEGDGGEQNFIAQSISLSRDYLLAYSAPPGFYSFRRASGSWFVTCLCGILQTQHRQMDLLSMLTLVNHQMAYEFSSNTPGRENKHTHRRRIVPWICSMLTKDVRLRAKTQADKRITFV